MTQSWRIVADWEPLDHGSIEERACFAALGIEANDVWLTEGRDAIANRLRRSPFLSAYHLAEWFAWNWWRLRWESRAASKEWDLAHKVSSIGGGYIWPNITFFSDGQRTTIVSRATRERLETPFRYIVDFAMVLPSTEFEAQVDEFMAQVIERLQASGVENSNLSRIWDDVTMERRSAELARVRKLEALLGGQPDEVDEQIVSALLNDGNRFGDAAMEELAADRGQAPESSLVGADDLMEAASRVGFRARSDDAVRMVAQPNGQSQWSEIEAWRFGASMARRLRDQERLGDGPISNDRLSDLIAVDRRAVTARDVTQLGVSFLLGPGEGEERVVLRSKWETGRRFELARLLGDSLMNAGGRLFPATRAYTYRQRVQGSFAAELLSPSTAVLNMLEGDFSQERQLDAAHHFGVSEITIRTELVNHKILDRDDLEVDLLTAAA